MFNKTWLNYLAISICVIVAVVLFSLHASLLTWSIYASTILGILSAKHTAEGRWSAFIFDLTSYAIYIYVCLYQKFYGEFVLAIIVVIMDSVSLFAWKNNQDKNRHVKIRALTKKEIIISVALSVVATAIYIFLLYVFKSELPILNGFATVAFLYASYLCYRRTKLQFVVYFMYNVIYMVLWITALASGTIGSIMFLVEAVAGLIYDIIGFVKWREIRERQQLES